MDESSEVARAASRGRRRPTQGRRPVARVRRVSLLVAAGLLAAGCTASTGGLGEGGGADALESAAHAAPELESRESDDVESGSTETEPRPADRVPAIVQGGTPCVTVGAEAATADGRTLRCTDAWGRWFWRPIPDAVAVQAHEELIAWFQALPPGGAEVPIERHPSVPEAYEQELRAVLDIAQRAHSTTTQRWVALLYPHDEEGVELAIERAIANTRPAERESLRANWAVGLRQARCNSYNQVGRNPDTGLGFIIATIPVTSRMDCQMESPEQVTAQLLREYLMGVGRPRGEPCWSGEGAGWPMARAVIDIAGGTSWEDDWGFWVGQILPGGWHFDSSHLGLRRSTDWAFAPEREQYCFSGVGHIQGSLAHETIIVDHGLPAWVESWRDGTGVRGASGLSFDEVIDRADRRFLSLGGLIDTLSLDSLDGLVD